MMGQIMAGFTFFLGFTCSMVTGKAVNFALSMSLFVASLNSGSNGNCYYIGNAEESVLVDGGISCRETEKRMKRLGLSMRSVRALFVTHEHGDHTHGIPALSKKYQLPVYITDATLRNCNLEIEPHLVVPLLGNRPVAVGALSVTAVPKLHDADDPHGFVIECNGVMAGVFTDFGSACENVIGYFRQCNAAFLESNYDEHMLMSGNYPYHLKVRIQGERGHMSNAQAMQLFLEHRPPFMTHLFLSHLSAHNNSPRIVRDLFKDIAGDTEIVIATRRRETKLYHIRSSPLRHLNRRSLAPVGQTQLSLFQ